MTCSSCNQENREGARFCLTCGRALEAHCAACGRGLLPEARYCDACGRPRNPDQVAPTPTPGAYTPRHLADRILTARASLEGERKQVTVLFADVAGFTSIAERLDPEEVHGVMDRCFSLLADAVHAYEGTINQFTGDGIMALFGAPLAHENAPERAVLAALDIQTALEGFSEEVRRELGVEFRMRIGAHTGPVVVGRIGDDLRMDYTAIGDTTNLAARLQAAAAPGGILISETTARLAGGRFQLEALGKVALKGKAEAIAAYRVVRALARAPLVAPAEGGLTPLVGRDGELAELERLLAEVATGRGHVAFVVGDAGIGKSRLLHELRLRHEGTEATWLVGRCISFGRSIPFLPVVDLLRGAMGIEDGDDPEAVAEKVRAGVRALGPGLEATEPYLRSVLAIDAGDPAIAAMGAGPRHFATFEALKHLFLGLATRGPLVLLIEDLHWIDPLSEDFLAYILDAVAGAPILLLCTHRPEYLSRLAARSFVTRVALQPLSREETSSMASAVLGTSDLPEQVAALVAHKTDGNPFFIEEVTKSLLEAGALARDATGKLVVHRVDDAIIPDSIHDVIQARIDRLGDEPKRAIQVASVIGREFALRLLQRATEFGDRATELVSELRSLELIYEKSGVPELAYMFKHALTHDVAYASLLLQRRRHLHRTIGLAIEELYADRLAEHWETLAHHFHRAEDWPKAFDYLVKAADRAGASYANAEAVHFYRLALETAERIDVPPERRLELLEARAHAHKAVSEFPDSIASYRAALELTEDLSVRARIETALADALWYAHEFDASIAAARRALDLCEDRPEELARAGEAFGVLGIVHIVRGQLEEGARFIGESCRLARESGHRRLRAQAEGYQGLLANWRGEYSHALTSCEDIVAELRSMNELFALTEVSSHVGVVLGGAGQYSRAIAVLRDSIATAESIGEKFWRARMWNTLGWVYGDLGAFEEADETNHRCLELARQMGSLRMTPELVGNARANLADVALGRGDLGAAETHLAEVAAILADARNEWMTWRYRMHFQCTAAELALARGDLGRAREMLDPCLATARRTRSRRYIVRAERLLAHCHLAADDLLGAEPLLRQATDLARQVGNPPQRWLSLLAQGRMLERIGREDEARATLREAGDTVRGAAESAPPEIREALQRSPAVRALRELGL